MSWERDIMSWERDIMTWEREYYVVGTRSYVVGTRSYVVGTRSYLVGTRQLCRGNEIICRGNEIIMSWERDKYFFTCPLSAAVRMPYCPILTFEDDSTYKHANDKSDCYSFLLTVLMRGSRNFRQGGGGSRSI